ncbi:MAG: hypothetical protein ACO1OQ_09400 [Rufibacter sp.]
MKKVIAMFALGVMVAGTSFAQEAPKKDKKPRTERSAQDGRKGERKSPEEMAAKRAEMLGKQYGLSTAQQAKLLALHKRQAQEMTAMRGEHTRGQELSQEKKDAMKAKHAQWEAELKSIFTPEQYAKYEADQKQRHESRGKKSGHARGEHKGKGQKKDQSR